MSNIENHQTSNQDSMKFSRNLDQMMQIADNIAIENIRLKAKFYNLENQVKRVEAENEDLNKQLQDHNIIFYNAFKSVEGWVSKHRSQGEIEAQRRRTNEGEASGSSGTILTRDMRSRRAPNFADS